MSMIGELRQVPASLIPALEKPGVIDTVMAAKGLSLDKAWDGLRYLLSNDCDPLTGGTTFTPGDCGYGPPVLMTSDEVNKCSQRLATITETHLTGRYDPRGMTSEEIYPSIWNREEERDQNLSWLLGTFRNVRAFYLDASERGNAVLFFLT